jgi:hypothetical protein
LLPCFVPLFQHPLIDPHLVDLLLHLRLIPPVVLLLLSQLLQSLVPRLDQALLPVDLPLKILDHR